ncbi:hypothetical protein ACHAWU_002759 [Discostella pseudostelligera]|uniref:Uncharacterized protein n=1 Tax=Discostella pseudostelligera TaxID=259834 RepID=A0ABD3MQ57_9STRA
MMGSYYPTSIGGEEEESAGSMYQDDGTCTSNNSSISIVLAGMNNIASSSSSSSSSSCAYITNQTIYIMAPSTSTNNENGTVVVEKKLSGGNSAYFGDTAIIVSYNSDGTAGAVWVLDYSNTNNNNGTTTTTTTSQQQQGSWEQTGILQTEYEDQLGWSVAIKGNSTFVVGAPGYQGMEVPLPSDGWFWSGRGNAIVMTKIDDDDNGGGATSWVRQDELVPISANDTAGFGNSVDIAECECLIAVGAWHDRDSRGSAYVFEKTTNGTWIELQKLAFNDTRRSQSGTLHGNYGYNVAISDEYLAVKAPYDSYIGSYDYEDVNRGVTYVYQRRGSDDGLYEQISRLCTPEGKQVGGVFRDMIFLDDFLLVGAPGKNTVYVFKQLDDTSGFVKTAELKLNDEDITDESSFGIRLDGKGNHVMVGDLGGKMSYIFAYEDGIWKQKSYIDSVDTASSGTSIVTYSPESFVVDGEQYGETIMDSSGRTMFPILKNSTILKIMEEVKVPLTEMELTEPSRCKERVREVFVQLVSAARCTNIH